MRSLTRSIVALSVLVVVAGGLVLWLALDAAPAVVTRGHLDADSIRRARTLLRAHDPRQVDAATASVRSVSLLAGDVDQALDYLVARVAGGGARLTLGDGRATVLLTMPAPLPGGRYLNVRAELTDGERLPELAALQVGSLPVAPWLARSGLWLAGLVRPQLADDMALLDLLHRVRTRPQALDVTYEWHGALPRRLVARLVDGAARDRLQVYHERVVALSAGLDWGASLSDLLRPVFGLAAERSSGSGADPVAENRAALIVLAAYASGRSLLAFEADAARWARPSVRRLRLHGRTDLARHYLISAGITAFGGGALADAVGLFKEVDDAGIGSGFSFTDIAANRAGARLGEVALASPGSARRTQRWLAQGLADVDLVPDPAGLPEYLSEAEFQRRYQAVGSAPYGEVVADIERRIGSLALYKPGVGP